jgi:chitin synthase
VNRTVDPKAVSKWVRLVGDFIDGDNQEGIKFDGVDFDNEEGHHPDDGSPGGSIPGLGNNCSSNPDYPWWQCPYHAETESGGEVLTSAGGMDFIADLTVELRAELDYRGGRVLTTAIQPGFFSPFLHGHNNCGPSTDKCSWDPLAFGGAFPMANSLYRNVNCYLHMLTTRADADVYDDYISMLYPNNNFRNWGNNETTDFYNSSTDTYHIPKIVMDAENYSYVDKKKSAPFSMPWNATVMHKLQKLVIAVQATVKCGADTFICPHRLDREVASTMPDEPRDGPRDLAVWNLQASCESQQYYHAMNATAYGISPVCNTPVVYAAWEGPAAAATIRTVSKAYMISIITAVAFFAMLLLWYSLLLPIAEARGVRFPQGSIVRSLRTKLGYHLRSTKLEGWEVDEGMRRHDTPAQPHPQKRTLKSKGGPSLSRRFMHYVSSAGGSGRNSRSGWTSGGSQRLSGSLDGWDEDGEDSGVLRASMGQRDTWSTRQITGEDHPERPGSMKSTGLGAIDEATSTDDDGGGVGDDVVEALSRAAVAQEALAKAAHELSQAIASEASFNGRFTEEAFGHYTNASKFFHTAADATADISMQDALIAKAQHASLCSEELRSGNNRSGFHAGGYSHTPFTHSVGGVSKSFDLTVVTIIEHVLDDLTVGTLTEAGVYLAAKEKLGEKYKRHLSAQEKARLTTIVHLLRATQSNNDGKDMKANLQEVQERLSERGALGTASLGTASGFISKPKGALGGAEISLEDVEITQARYTAVTTKKPADFSDDQNILQVTELHRKIDVMICVTMYNEDATELTETLTKIGRNIKHMVRHPIDSPDFRKHGESIWRSIVTTIICDGRQKMDPSTMRYLHDMGLLDENLMGVALMGDSRPELHLFEGSVQLTRPQYSERRTEPGGADTDDDTAGRELESLPSAERSTSSVKPKKVIHVPMQLQIGIKEHNAGKLNSHSWAFHGLAMQMDPKYIVLVDVGTKPTPSAISRLLRAMEEHPNVGGCCGEIAVDHPFEFLTNPTVAAQHFEYKTSNILDKPMESVFGFITVLPGAFSAYRFEAIQGKPLEAYFKSLSASSAELGAFEGNMYLAEDRILVFELLAKQGSCWTLEFVKDAVARTDVPETLVDLIKQRRRWLNGSLFALTYALLHFDRFYTESGHSVIRKAWISLQFVYMVVNLMVVMVIPALFYLAIYYIMVVNLVSSQDLIFPPGYETAKSLVGNVAVSMDYVFILLGVFQLVIGLGNKPQYMRVCYSVVSIYYALVMMLTTITIVNLILIAEDDLFGSTPMLVMFLGGGVLLPLVAATCHFELHHLLATIVQYYAMLGTMVYTLNIYAFCNVHDLSWGTKGAEAVVSHSGGSGAVAMGADGKPLTMLARMKLEEGAKKKAAQEAADTAIAFENFRSQLLLVWISLNLGVSATIKMADPTGADFMFMLVAFVSVINFIRFSGSIIFLAILFCRSTYACFFGRNAGGTEANWNHQPRAPTEASTESQGMHANPLAIDHEGEHPTGAGTTGAV